MTKPTYKFALRDGLDDNFLPSKGEPHATGWDVRAAFHDKKDLVIKPGEYFKIPLGFRSLPPEGWWYHLHPRSSSFTKKHVHCLIGTVDESWEGETLWAGQYQPDATLLTSDLVIKYGEAVAQIIPVRREEMNVMKVSNSELDQAFETRGYGRKTGGFGSTG
jgi:dUTPase